MQLNEDKTKRLQRLANIVDNGEIAIASEITAIEDKVDALAEEVKTIELKEGIPGIPGTPGNDYILTEEDKIQIAEKIKVPVVEKVIEKTTETIIKEQPIVKETINNTTIENPVTPVQVRDKLETLKDENRLDISAIKGVEKTHNTLTDSIINRAIGIVDQRTSFLINKVSNIQAQVNGLGGSGTGGHIIQEEGTSLTARSKLNFVGAGVTVTDGGAGTDSTIVTMPLGNGSMSSQVLSGTIDGSNKTFTFASSLTSLSMIDLNGTVLIENTDYTVSGTTVTYTNAPPDTGGTDTHLLIALTSSGAGTGTVTSVSVVTANGVSGSVATATTTPAITLTLGALTPSSVAATGTVTGSNLSGTNTGDQTNITGNSATVTVADAGGDTTTWPLLGTSQTGSLAPATDAGLTFNATTNALTTTTFIGALTGNADTVTGFSPTSGKILSVSKTMTLTAADDTGVYTLPTGTKTLVATDVATLSSLVSIGTVTTGTWSATTIALNKGGTGQTTKAAAFDALSPMTTGGDLTYGGASGTGTRLANGSSGQVLTSAGTTLAPTWTTPTTGTVTAVSVATANGFAGSSSGGATPALTLTTTVTGTLQGDGTSISASKVVLTQPATSSTLTILNGKTLTVNKTLTLDGTDSTTMTFPTTSATIARTDAANTFTGHQTVEGVTSTGATGTGKFVFDTSPVLVTPALGTPASGVMTNVTGTASGLTAGLATDTVTKTGTGSTYVTNASPTIVTPTIAKLANLTTNGFVKTSSGDGTLSVDTSTYLTANQTITLSGDVSGSGTTTITTTLINNPLMAQIFS